VCVGPASGCEGMVRNCALETNCRSQRMNSVAAAPTLLVHGGAGVIRRDMDADTERGVRAALAEALRRGHAVLAAGGSALDAATAAVVVLEDAPCFNAGHGAVF